MANNTMNFGVDLLPTTTNTFSLGSSEKKWNLYVNQINGLSPITGVKGNAETTYRTGQVNLTPANIGAVGLTGNDTISGVKTFNNNITFSAPSVAGEQKGFVFKGVTDSAGLYYLEPNLNDDGRMRFVISDNDSDSIEMAWSLYRSADKAIPGQHVVHTFNARGYTLSPIEEADGTKNTIEIKPSINNFGSIGNASYKWANIYATNFYGNLTGNASTASSIALSGVTGADDLKAIEALTDTSGFLKKTAANTWALDACDDVVKKRDFLLTESNEEVDLIKLKPGVYDHISSFNNFLPTNWGTLLHIGGKYKYGAFIAAESANILYYKTYFYESDDNWFWREENWQTIAHATKSTSNIGSATQPVYMTSTGVITAGTALKALAYKDSLVASDIPELSTDKLTSGTLPIERGGTNATTAANASWNLLHINDPSDLNTAKRMGSFKISNSTTNTPESSMWGATWNIVDDNPNGNNGTSGSTWQLVFKAASTDMWLRAITNSNDWTDYAKFLTDKHLHNGIDSNSTTLAATANAAYTASRNSLHTLGTTTKFYLTGCSSSTTNTAGDIFDTGIYSTTTAGELSAVRHTLNLGGTDKAYMTWNNTDQSIDFVFN